jgi:hypothetical protein
VKRPVNLTSFYNLSLRFARDNYSLTPTECYPLIEEALNDISLETQTYLAEFTPKHFEAAYRRFAVYAEAEDSNFNSNTELKGNA